jgi:hypothetical protein
VELTEKVQVRLSKEDAALLATVAKARRCGQSPIVREALIEWFARRGFLSEEEKTALGVRNRFLKRAPRELRLARQILRPRRSGLRDSRGAWPRIASFLEEAQVHQHDYQPARRLVEELDRFAEVDLPFSSRSATVATLVALELEAWRKERAKVRVPG